MSPQTQQNELNETAKGYKPLIKEKVEYKLQHMISTLTVIGVSKDAIAEYIPEMMRQIGSEIVRDCGKVKKERSA